jgi:hypothetical protein
MNLTDALCLLTGLLWGYFFFPVFMLARVMADLVAHGSLLDGPRWSTQPLVWKVTLLLGIAFVYLVYVALGALLLEGYRVRIDPPAEIGGKLWALGFFAGFIAYGALTARSTWTRRKRRAS